MQMQPTLKQYSLDDFLGMSSSDSSYVPQSNVDIFIKDPISTRNLDRRDELVEAFLKSMYSKKPDLTNFRVVYPVDQGCCFCFWSSPPMLKLHQKVPTPPGSMPKFSIEFRVETSYLQSVTVEKPQRVVDYGATSISAVK